jgi:hypothetical protein
MAAPHVAGTVALLQQAARSKLGHRLSPAAIEDIIEDGAHKLTAGASYQPDPSKPGSTTSFDKGHGLLDVVNSLRLVLGVPLGEPGPPCPAGSILATDPKGDATLVAFTDGGKNVPTLDVVGVDVAGIPSSQLFVISFRIADLTDANPPGTAGIEFEGTLAIGKTTIDVVADRSLLGATFLVGDTEVRGAFDAKHDTVTILVPRKALGALHGSVTVDRITGDSRRGYTAFGGPVADNFSGACPRTVDIGG